MSRKYGRGSALDDDDYDDYDDFYDDYGDEDSVAAALTSSVGHPPPAAKASKLGTALFSPLPRSSLKRADGGLSFKLSTLGQGSLFLVSGEPHSSTLAPTSSEGKAGVVPFKFDTPSPDDRVRISQSGTRSSSGAAKTSVKPVATKPAMNAKPKKSQKAVQASRMSSRGDLGVSESKAEFPQEEDAPSNASNDAEVRVFEGLMHLTLDSQGRGQRTDQKSTGSRKRLPLDQYEPESWIIEEIRTERKPLLHLVVIGHVDAGKSTLMGHILHLLGVVSQKDMHKNQKESKQKGKGSFAYAWVLDEGSEERARGVTMSVAVAHFETSKLRVVLLDAPGHKDFVPNMISGAAQADAAILVVDASIGAFEAGLAGDGRNGGQTQEHAQLARSLGVEQLTVAVNKMDTVDYSQDRYSFIRASLRPLLKQCGFRESAVRWIPVSAIDGQNLIAHPSTTSLASWYTGTTLLESINLFEEPFRNTLKPLRLVIAEVVKGHRLGQAAVSGKIESGALRIGSKVLVMPMGEAATVKSLERDGEILNVALAGDSIDVGLTGVDPGVLLTGGVLCHLDYPVPLVTRVEARVLILGITTPVLRGGQVVLHTHHARESVQIADLVAVLDPKTGAVTRKKPRCLLANQSALIEIVPERSLCLEEYTQFKSLGRIALRDAGRTLAVGIVTRIISQQ